MSGEGVQEARESKEALALILQNAQSNGHHLLEGLYYSKAWPG